MNTNALLCTQDSFSEEEEGSPNAYAWVFPPSPATNGIIVIMNDECAEEIIDMIRHDFTNEDGTVVEGKRSSQMLQYASRLEQNISQKRARRALRSQVVS